MTFEDIYTNQPQALIDIVHQLRGLILDTDNRIEEHVYGGEKVRMTLYSINHTNNVLYGLAVAKDHVKLYLHHTEKADTQTLKLEGKGKHAKTVKIKTVDEDYLTIVKRVLSNIRDAADY